MTNKGSSMDGGSEIPGKALSRLVIAQVIIAVCALAVTIVFAVKIPKLIQTKSQLQADVRDLEKKKSDLEKQNQDLDRTRQYLTNALLVVKDKDPALARAAINSAEAQVTPTVQIYTADKDQEPKANQLAAGLHEKGFLTTVEYEGDAKFFPEQTEVRFFRVQDKAEAQVILGIAQNNFGITNSRWSYVLPTNAGKTAPRQFEIWFKKDPL